jgi:hypothetical protein
VLPNPRYGFGFDGSGIDHFSVPAACTVASRPKILQNNSSRPNKESDSLEELAAVRPPFLEKAAENRPKKIFYGKHYFLHEILHLMSIC